MLRSDIEMDKLGNTLQILMWIVVVLAILIFVISIIVEHTNSYDFLYSLMDEPSIVTNNIKLLS